jgi:branched-chain amino acid transport system substrate-binding protein
MAAGVSRREFLRWGMGVGAGLAAVPVVGACSSGDSESGGRGGASDAIKVGVIAPFSGLGAFVGTITRNSLEAAVQHVNANGGVGGRKVELVMRDTGQEITNGVRAYQEFAGDPQVAGVLWCGGLGFDESRNLIKRDGMPVMAVFEDPASSGNLYPDVDERTIFQFLMSERMAMDVLCQYLKVDRGYQRVALLFDSTVSEGTRDYYQQSIRKVGLESVAIETFNVFASEFGPQLQRLRGARPEALFVWGLPANTGGVAQQLDQLGSAYVDTPTAKAPAPAPWHPHVIGAPTGTGDKSFAELAQGSAKVGTVTCWHLGGLVYLPTFAIRDWMKTYLNKTPTGGEEVPADGLGTIVNAIQKGGSTDRRKIVDTIETMGRVSFASIEFGFTADNHLARTFDEMIIVTLERSSGPASTDPPYQLGREWREVFPPGYAGPTQLVRPTVDANRRANAAVVDQVLKDGWGTQCTPACKIH